MKMRNSATKCMKEILKPARNLRTVQFHLYNSSRSCSNKTPLIDVKKLLAEPTWSVASLLPPQQNEARMKPEISSKQLHHLLRLSALPPPKDKSEEAKMLDTLSSQLHFVKDIQKVDTSDVEPLRSLRDETTEGEREAELSLEALKGALGREEVKGTWHRRIRRKRIAVEREEEWDVLGAAERRIGQYFVVEGGKG